MQLIVIKLLLISTLSLNVSYGSECIKALGLCHDAIKAFEKVDQDKTNLIDQQVKLLTKQEGKIKDLEEEQNAWYNNKWMWIGIGVVGGAAAAHKLRK